MLDLQSYLDMHQESYGGIIRGINAIPQKMLKSGDLDLLKMHLPYNIYYIILQSIHFIYTIVHLRWMHIIAFLRSYLYSIQVTFFLLVRIIPLNFSFYLNYYNYLFFFHGEIFAENFLGSMVRYFSAPGRLVASLHTPLTSAAMEQ